MSDTDLRTPIHNGHLMVSALKRYRHQPVMHLGDTTLTGGQVADRISQYVQAFEALGAGTGTASALLALNRPEVLFILGAGQTQGYRRTSLHPLGSADDHAYVINDAGITVLIIDPFFTDRAVELLEKCPKLTQVLTIGPVPAQLEGKAVDLVAAAATYPVTELAAKLLPPDHVLSITYTGGTTGTPKGVIGTVGGFHTMAQIQLAEWEWPANPKFLICTPLSHAGAAFFVPTVMKGGCLYVLSRFDPAEVLEVIEREKITATMLVPSMLYALLDHPDSHTRDLSSLETVYYGAAAINPTRLQEAIQRFGPIFAQYYGQSEAPMAITYLAKDDHLVDGATDVERLASCGRPSAFIRAELLDEDNHPVPAGQPGEICVAGPLLAAGYLNQPEETAATFRNGWLRTGDIAREDADGFWYIIDRVKDMIITGGFNIFPKEVEDVLAAHPSIAEVGVIGTPDERWGEMVTAVVVLRAGFTLDDELRAELETLVKDKKGSVAVPKRIEVVDALPLTGLGKPDKKALRKQFWDDQDRNVG